jgi:hypothetical protein
MIKQLIQYVPPFLTDCMQTGNAMKQREINMILSNNAATSDNGESFINLKILDVGKWCIYDHALLDCNITSVSHAHISYTYT